MNKKTKDVLAVIGAEVVAAALFAGAIVYLVTKYQAGQHIVTNRYNFNVPVAGGVAILAILGAVVLVGLPRALWREKNMSKSERKKRRRQQRRAKSTHGTPDLPWH